MTVREAGRLAERLAELKAAGVPRCRTEDAIHWRVMTSKSGTDVPAALAALRDIAEINADLDPYFHAFVRPARRDEPIVVLVGDRELELRHDRCVGCDHITSFSFQWGIAHGEGICGNCGWPYRLYHWPRPASDPDNPAFAGRIQKLLAFHPDDMEVR